MKKGLLLILSILLISGVYASSYSIEFNQIGDKLVLKENNNGNQTSVVTQEGLDKITGGYYFIKKIQASNNFNNYTVKLNLDKGIITKEDKIFPINYITTTDGQAISLSWNYEGVKKGDQFAFFVELEDTKQTNNYSWILIVGIIIILIVSGFFIFRYLKNKKENLDKHLLDEERKVIQILKKADRNELWQKNIQSTLGLSKAKTSRLIRNLESRNIIEKIPFGNTNKVILK